MKFSGGTIVDATLIAAPPLVKNQDKSRDPEMHQTKKDNLWHFGMKLHIGADSRTGLVHSAGVAAANIHDSHAVPNLLYGEETRFYGASTYWGKEQCERLKEIAPQARDFTNKHAYKNRPLTEADRETNRCKSSVRPRVEHLFLILKRLWGFAKVRHCGLAKNIYGTGCFLLQNIGTKSIASKQRLLTSATCKIGSKQEYALEGSAFIGRALMQWLRDGLHLVRSAPEVDALATSVPDSGGIILVPAFIRLGAPHSKAWLSRWQI